MREAIEHLFANQSIQVTNHNQAPASTLHTHGGESVSPSDLLLLRTSSAAAAMPRPGGRAVPLLLLLLLLLAATAAVLASAAAPAGGGAAADFIQRSCRATQYPSVCVQSLASYGTPPRSPRELARAALSVSADRARAASAYVGRLCGGGGSKGGGAAAKKGGKAGAASGPVRDCMENLADSVGHLRDAAQEMGGAGMAARPGSPAFKWHLSNVQTWCSAALTDENTCLDGLSARGLDAATRAAIRGKVVEVAQVTSNALALVNKVAPPAPY